MSSRLKTVFFFLTTLVLFAMSMPLWATPPDNRPPDNRPPDREGDVHVETQTESEARADSNAESHADSESNADANAVSDSTSAGGAGGSSTVNTKSENNSIVLTGARDTAECFTKVTIGAEGFGIGFSRKDKYCRKVRLVARQIELGNYDAAAKLECTLPEWKEVFDDKDECYEALLYENMESNTGEYDGVVAQVSQEEYYAQQEILTEQAELAIDKAAQAEALAAEQAAEIERLKREAAKREREREAAKKAALAALEKKG